MRRMFSLLGGEGDKSTTKSERRASSRRAGAKRATEARRVARRELTRRFQIESLEDRLAMDGAMSAWSIEQLPTYGTYEKFRADIVARAEEDFQWYFGREETYYPPVWDDAFDYASDLTPVLYSSADNQTMFRNALHSESSVAALIGGDGGDQTNNQVAGVDEIDRVETDGSYLYILRNGQLDIVDARDPANPTLASSTEIAGWIEGEYLFGDRLTVISIETNQPWMVPAIWPPSVAYTMAARSAGTTTVTVYDVSDRTAPRVVEKTQLDGGYVDSRAIDDKVYVVLSSPMPTLPMPSQVCDDGSTLEAGMPPAQWIVPYGGADGATDDSRLAWPESGEWIDANGDGAGLAEAEGDDESLIDIVTLSDEEATMFAYASIGEDGEPLMYATGGLLGEDGEPMMYTLGGGLLDGETDQLYRTQGSRVGCVYETREQWLARIEADIDPSIYRQLPHFTSNSGNGEFERAGLLYEPSDIVMPVSVNARQLMTVTSFDVDDDHAGPLFAQGVVTGWNSTIYASHDHLVLAENEYSYDGMSQRTSLLMMDWDTETGRVWVSSSGKIDGYVNGRFAIDEFDGTLRVVATESGWTGERFQIDHTLHVFKQVGTSLDEIGSVTGFGENETVRSVRFFGDRAFVVTAVTTDPLFAIDLSDPTQPTVKGELVLPGFSGYLQMLDGTHLIGIGQEPNDDGIWVQKASLFNVADLTNPIEIGKITLQTGASSLAQWDSHALTWLPDEHLLAIPVTNSSYVMLTTEEGFEIPQPSFTEGLMVLDINLVPTETLLPEMRVVAEIPHDSPVLRSVHLGDYLVSIAEHEIKAMSIADPATVAGELDLPTPSPEDPGSGYSFDPFGWFYPGIVHPILYNFLPEPVEDGESVNGQVTDLVRNAMSDLAERLGIDEGVIRLISTESTEWLDGVLGLTEADPENPPTPADGVQVVLAVGARKYLFHANEDGAIGLANDNFEFGESEMPEWHNIDLPADVTSDGFITPHDALAIIDELNSTGARMLRSQRPIGAIGAEGEAGFRPRYFWDVNGDRYVSPADALWVINRLNADPGSSEDAGDAAIDAGASSRMAIWAGDGTEGSGDYFPSDPDVIDVGAGDEFAPKQIAPIFIKPIDDGALGDEFVGDEFAGDEFAGDEFAGDEFVGDVIDESGEKKSEIVDDSSSEIDYATIVAEEKDESLGIDEFVRETAPEFDPSVV